MVGMGGGQERRRVVVGSGPNAYEPLFYEYVYEREMEKRVKKETTESK